MSNFFTKGDGENLSDLMDASRVGNNGSTNNDPANTISADNGEVINLDAPPAHTKD